MEEKLMIAGVESQWRRSTSLGSNRSSRVGQSSKDHPLSLAL